MVSAGGGTSNSGGGQPPTLDKIFAVGINDEDGKVIELFGSSTIYGDTCTNSTAAGSVYFASSTRIRNGDLYIGPGGDGEEVAISRNWRGVSRNIPDGEIKNLVSIQTFSLPIYPSFPDLPYRGTLDAGWYPIPEGGHRISEDGSYSNINVSKQLTIDIGDDDRVICADSLNVTGHALIVLNRSGSGKLLLYVADTFNLTGDSSLNDSGDCNALIMFYSGDESFNLLGDTDFNGSVFVQNADVQIGGSSGFTGNLVSGGNAINISGNVKVNINGNGSGNGYCNGNGNSNSNGNGNNNGTCSSNIGSIYAPNASLLLSGSSEIYGSVIVHDMELIGNAGIHHLDSIDMSFFNLLGWNTSSVSGSQGTWVRL